MNTLILRLRIAFVCVAIGFLVPARADFFSSKRGSPHVRTEAEMLADYAKFKWLADQSQPGVEVTRIVISLADQRLYAFHAAQLVAWSNVSTGRSGFDTPTGAFDISQKDIDHHSSLYDSAPMPFFMRLTDGGVGLHAGFLPGYPASHGCVRLPLDMARELFQHVDPGTPVQIVATAQNVAVDEPVSRSGTSPRWD